MNKVLLVRLSSMGDLIHTFPAITDLATARPELTLDWLCEEAFVDIACLHPFIKTVHPMAGRRWRKNMWSAQTRQEKKRLKENLSTQKYDAVIDSQGLLKSALYARVGNSPIYGLDKKSAREPLASLFYQHKYPVAWGQLAIERNRQLFSQAFKYTLPEKCSFGIPSIKIEGEERLEFLDAPYAVLLHATSQERKLWAEENWLALAEKLWDAHQYISFLPWGNEEEKARAERIASQSSHIRVCPKISLKQAAQLLSQSQCVVGVDTGLLHLANALDKPLCGIYTDTDPKATGILTTEKSINLGGIKIIPSVNDVMTELEKILARQ